MVLVWAAIVGLVLIAIVGLAGDTAYVNLVGHQLQNAADAAALAGAARVQTSVSDAHAAATTLAYANRAGGNNVQLAQNHTNAAGGDIVVGHYDVDNDTFTVTLDNPNAVRVLARRTNGSPGGPLPLIFGPMAGVNHSNVSRTATAVHSAIFEPAVIVLNRTARQALYMNSNARINITGWSSVQVNSSASDAVYMNSNSVIDAKRLNVYGGTNIGGGSDVTGTIDDDAPVIPDPLAALPEPSYNAGNSLGTIFLDSDQRRTVTQAGYYAGGIDLRSNSQLTISGGVYILGGVGLRMDSNARLTANGVMFFVVGPSASVRLLSNTTPVITPMTTGPYAGIAIFQARSNRNQAVIDSNAASIGGVLYFPSAPVSINSNGAAFGDKLIVDTLRMDSNARINIDASDAEPLSGRVYLVR